MNRTAERRAKRKRDSEREKQTDEAEELGALGGRRVTRKAYNSERVIVLPVT